MNKIIIDCFGCDNPTEVIKGCGEAAKRFDVDLVLCGNKNIIESTLGDECRLIKIADAPDVITNDDSPVRAIKSKPLSSLVVAYNALKSDGEVLISAGSTGAVLCGGVILLGKADDVERPTLVSPLPNDKGGLTFLTDCGANVDCSPTQLLQFAKCAVNYAKSQGILSPKVGLLSVGKEDKKGNALTKETFLLLKDSDLSFVGNIEANAALSGEVDVIVADGFCGNILLKSIEGSAKSIIRRSISAIMERLPSGCDGNFVNAAFSDVIKSIDFNNQGAAALLGLKKTVLKAHGAATSQTMVNTVKQALVTLNK